MTDILFVVLPHVNWGNRSLSSCNRMAEGESGLSRVLSMSQFFTGSQKSNRFALLFNRMLTSTIFSVSIVAALCLSSAIARANDETRSISLYHNRTGESLTVTYMKNGKYVPSAMKQIDYLLRDWRRNEVIAIDPRTIDLIWELHEDLRSKQPIRIVCGYRSGKTNALLRRIGRKVAEKSQHIRGKAIDFYFTDVPTITVRNIALARKFGGVGYYTGPSGFLHLDSGNVRQWGPFISDMQMAQIMSDGPKTIGRHSNQRSNSQLAAGSDYPKASKTNGLLALIQKRGVPAKQVPVATAYAEADQDLADLSGDATLASIKSIKKVGLKTLIALNVNSDQMAMLSDLTKAATADPLVTSGNPIPKPRLKPPGLMLQIPHRATSNSKLTRVIAANAPPPSRVVQLPLDRSALSTVYANVTLQDEARPRTTISNARGKSSFAAEVRRGTANGAPLIKPLLASVGNGDTNWWPTLFLDANSLARRDGTPPLIGTDETSSLPVAANLNASAEGVTSLPGSADGKGDLLVVAREGKGDLDPIKASSPVAAQ